MIAILHHLFVRPALALGLVVALGTLSPVLAASVQEDKGIEAFASQEAPPTFDSAAAAVDAFETALADDNLDSLARLLGLDAAKLKADEGSMDSYARIRKGAARQLLVEEDGDRVLIDLGAKLWPFPFPVVKADDGKWAFDTQAGLEEIVNRRIGENELETIATMRAYVAAQHDYASADRDGDGVLEFAQKLLSGDGETDGLYWTSASDAGESPAGEFVDQAALGTAREGRGYFGYRYRILTGQGPRIAGGAYDYVINGNMIAGFALLAWPVEYGQTGVNTFMVNQYGIVYETDLGPATAEIVPYIERFNPDDSWDVVTD